MVYTSHAKMKVIWYEIQKLGIIISKQAMNARDNDTNNRKKDSKPQLSRQRQSSYINKDI